MYFPAKAISSRFTALLSKIKPDTSAKNKLPSLDGVRGMAALFVFLDHASGHNLTLLPWLDFEGTGLGKNGVYLFFVLSSFLLTRQLLKPQISLVKVETWLTYFQKRIFRIYPLYILVLLLYSIFPAFKYSWSDFLNHLFLFEGLNQFWAIPIEMKYYLMAPFIAIAFKALRDRLRIATGLTALVLAINYFLIPSDMLEPRLSVFKYLSIFMMGALFALFNSKLEQQELKSPLAKSGFEGLAIISFALILLSLKFEWLQPLKASVLGSYAVPEYLSYVLYGLFWSLFLVSHLYGYGWVRSILVNPFLCYVGMVSFGVYLWHMVFIGSLNPRLDLVEPLKLVVIFVLTLGFSTFTYFMVELPFMKMRLNLIPRKQAKSF